MRRYGIYAPVLGEREDYPTILLRNAITSENTNIQIWNGEIRKAKLRSPELLRTAHTIASLSTSASTATITGDVTAHYANGTSITLYDVDDNYEQHTLSTTSTFDGTSTTITVTGSITASTPDGWLFNEVDVGNVDPTNVDFKKVKFPDTYAALRYERFMLSTGVERLVGFTKAHIYYWDSTLTKWISIFTCSSDCTYWDASQYGDNLAVTNNIDRPKYWTGSTATSFVNLDTQLSSTTSDYIAKAKFIRTYRNYLFLGNVTHQDATVSQHHVYWSNIGEGVAASGWRQDQSKDSGFAYVSGKGEITGGFGEWQGYLIIFKRFSHRKFWFVGGTIPFEQDEQSPDVGCTAPGSVGNDSDGNLFYYGSDKSFREIAQGKMSHGKDKTARNINPSLLEGMRFTFIDEYGELRWSVPHGNSATANNKILVYKEGRWDTDIDIAVTAFGTYSRQAGYTWDTLPYSTWDTWGWDSWDAVNASSDFPIDICSDENGFTYDIHGAYTDNGSAYDSSFEITTDLAEKQALPYFKRVLNIYVYVYAESAGELSLSVKRDSESSFQSLGNVSLVGSETLLRVRLNVDFRARHFLIKVLGTTAYRFVGIEFEYKYSGTTK